MMEIKVLKLGICFLCVYVTLIGIKSVNCDEDDSLFQYDGETSMSNIDDANKEMYEDEISPLPDSGLVLEHEMIYEQSDQPVSGERFIAVRVDKMGATESLKPNLVGLSNMAIQFLPRNYKFVEVLEATREIVSGVRYELFVAARDENDETVLCRIVVTEIAWKITAWGEKQRDLNYSNCTSNATDDDNVPSPNDFRFNPLFVRKTNSISDDDLKLIESQILTPKQTQKNIPKPKISQPYDLSNLDAMIIPTKSLPNSMKIKLLSQTQNEVNDHTLKVSESQTLGDHTSTDQPHLTDVPQEMQIQTVATVAVDVSTQLLESFHENATKSLDSSFLKDKKIVSGKPVTDSIASDSAQQGLPLKSQGGVIDLNFTLESHAKNESVEGADVVTNTQNAKQTKETETEPLVEGTTSNLLKDDKERLEQFHLTTESVTLDDSIVSSPETVTIIKATDAERLTDETTEYLTLEEDDCSQAIDRPKRGIDTEMLYLKHLTDEALEQLDHIDSDNLKRIALDIIRVKKIEQDNGAIYVIKVRTANSNCLEKSDDQPTCLDNIQKDTIKICLIEVKSKRDVNRVTKSECGPDKSSKAVAAEPASELLRNKRSLFYDSHSDEERQETEYDRNVAMMFDEFKSKYNKKYESAMEHSTRLRLFKHNLHIINELNRLEMGTATYGITEFADFTLHEYKQRTGLLRRKESNEIPLPLADIPDIDLPKSFDWRDKGAVTEVKNQGSCGSCWAFSVTGNIEGLNAIKTGKLEEFSEQELVDCDTVDSGCNGGLPDNAYKAIEKIGGLETESAYPYDAKKSTCRFNPSLARVQVSGAVDLPQNETAIAQYLVENGPLSIGINANAMQFYRGGISHPPRILCRHSGIDHGVLIVGYGVAEYPVFNKTLPYWIIKNSWGPTWGEQGYYRVFRGDNTCGLTSMVSSAVLG